MDDFLRRSGNSLWLDLRWLGESAGPFRILCRLAYRVFLSIDNVFVFIIILARLKISKEKAQLVLLIGIILALILRGLSLPLVPRLFIASWQFSFIRCVFVIHRLALG